MEWSEAKGIATVNGVVQVVGWGDRQGRPGYNFLWTDGVRYDLNSLSSGSGLDLARANGINSAGQIVGKGFLRRLGARGYLLMPKL